RESVHRLGNRLISAQKWADMSRLGTKKPGIAGLFQQDFQREGLLDLGFFVSHVLAHHRIVLADLDFFRRGPLVLGGGIEVAGACTGHQTNFLTYRFTCHDSGLRYTFWPLARMSPSTLSMPSLSMIRMPLDDTRRRTKRFS